MREIQFNILKTRDSSRFPMDRHRTLPTEVLCQLFSYFDTETALRFSVLAKGYRDIWAKSPKLNITFKAPDCDVNYPFRLDVTRLLFEKDVTRLLKRRKKFDTSLESCRLCLRTWVSPQFISSFISYALRNNVKYLKIRGYTRPTFPAAKFSLTSSFLISLNLKNVNGDSLRLPKTVDLPNLKILVLKSFEFSVDEAIFSGGVCPKVEYLRLVRCSVKNGGGGGAGELKSLELEFLNLKIFEITDWSSPMISVSVPSLTGFKFEGAMAASVNFKVDMPHLEVAHIDLRDVGNDMTAAASEHQFICMLNQMEHLSFLSGPTNTIKVISEFKSLVKVTFREVTEAHYISRKLNYST